MLSLLVGGKVNPNTAVLLLLLAELILAVLLLLLLVAVLVMVLLLVLMLLMLPCRKHVHYGCATQHHHYRKHVHTVCLLPTSLRTSTTTIAPIPPILMTTVAASPMQQAS